MFDVRLLDSNESRAKASVRVLLYKRHSDNAAAHIGILLRNAKAFIPDILGKKHRGRAQFGGFESSEWNAPASFPITRSVQRQWQRQRQRRPGALPCATMIRHLTYQNLAGAVTPITLPYYHFRRWLVAVRAFRPTTHARSRHLLPAILEAVA